MFTFKRFSKFLATGSMPEMTALDESLEEHDKKYHGGHYDPEKQTCGKREKMAKGDDPKMDGNGEKAKWKSSVEKARKEFEDKIKNVLGDFDIRQEEEGLKIEPKDKVAAKRREHHLLDIIHESLGYYKDWITSQDGKLNFWLHPRSDKAKKIYESYGDNGEAQRKDEMNADNVHWPRPSIGFSKKREVSDYPKDPNSEAGKDFQKWLDEMDSESRADIPEDWVKILEKHGYNVRNGKEDAEENPMSYVSPSLGFPYRSLEQGSEILSDLLGEFANQDAVKRVLMGDDPMALRFYVSQIGKDGIEQVGNELGENDPVYQVLTHAYDYVNRKHSDDEPDFEKVAFEFAKKNRLHYSPSHADELIALLEKAKNGRFDKAPPNQGLNSNDMRFLQDIIDAVGEDDPLVKAIKKAANIS